MIAKIEKTTANNRLDFFYHDPFAEKIPIIPQIELKDEFNIADTHESFLLNYAFFIDIDLKSKELFEIKLLIMARESNVYSKLKQLLKK